METNGDDGESRAKSPAEEEMTTFSHHKFGDSDETDDSFSVTIVENLKEEYGLFVWPCSVILAEYVWQQRTRFSNATVVELGAGTSLPGLVAAKVGADVILTDDSNRSQVLDHMRGQCDLNDIKCKIQGLTWGVWDTDIFRLQPNIILGADVLYDTCGRNIALFILSVPSFLVLPSEVEMSILNGYQAFDDLYATVAFLLQSCPPSVFITTYHNRSGHHLIGFLMVKWGLKCVKLVDGFSFMPSNKTPSLSGNIQLAEIVLDTTNRDEKS